MDKNELEKNINEILKPKGFVKKGMTWYYVGKEIISAFNMQASSYGRHYYVNMCFAPVSMDLVGMPYPKYFKFPMSLRLDESTYLDEDLSHLKILNLECGSVEGDDMVRIIKKLVNYSVENYLIKFQNIEDLKDYVKEHGHKQNVTYCMMNYLGL